MERTLTLTLTSPCLTNRKTNTRHSYLIVSQNVDSTGIFADSPIALALVRGKLSGCMSANPDYECLNVEVMFYSHDDDDV